ncbi:unnamed protein product [Sphacelaria rigidula]
MLYADNAGIASRSRESLAKMITAVVEVHAAFGLVVAEKKTVTMHMRSPNMETDTIEVEAAAQRYKQIESFLYLGGKISSIGDVTPEIHSRKLARPGRASTSTAKRYTATRTSPSTPRFVS